MRGVLALAGALAVAGCAGPTPEVESVEVQAAGPGKVRVTVAVRNNGGGDGQATVDVTLRERTGGAVVARDDIDVDLKPHERLTVSREMLVPRTEDLIAEAEAHYPP